MRRRARTLAGIFLWTTLLSGAGTVPRASFRPFTDAQDPRVSVTLQAIVAAEDARAGTPAELSLLLAGTRSADPTIQGIAVRALGRLERVSLIGDLFPLLETVSARVRAEAANALAQSLTGAGNDAPDAVTRVADRLSASLDREKDAGVREALLRSLGRLPYRTPARVVEAEQRLAAALEADPLGALTGLASLYRASGKTSPPTAPALAAIERAFANRDSATLIRRMALSAVIAAARPSADIVRRALDDRDDQVRRLGVVAAALPDAPGDRRAVLTSALSDPAAMVRFEALRAYGRHFPNDCTPIVTAARDVNPHVALLAVDLLAQACPGIDEVTTSLETAAGGKDWRRAAHALVSLARRAPDRARSKVLAAAESVTWQIRMYAARAAGILRDTTVLERLAADSHDNVREAAIGALVEVQGHAADPLVIAALARPDYQLVLTAARALEGAVDRKAATNALLAAFDRITRERRDTSRDPRVAILERLRKLGSKDNARALEPCLRDFDPRVASECAATLRLWGEANEAAPSPLARPAPPSAPELTALDGARARITLTGGRVFELALLAGDAPLSATRFTRLARAGYYNGLTFHRVAPNFVIQGGSPGANEYAGDGPFMRDEVGLRSHLRRTVGISTRGRDTGDAQIFVNLVDNYRLDHTYTVFAEVVSGMDVVDGILEGDVMERVEIVR